MQNRRNDIEATAAHWATIAHDGWPSAEEERACRAWLDEDPRHIGAFARISAVLAIMDDARETAPAPNPDAAAFVEIRTPRAFSRRRFLTGLAAATVLVAGLQETTPRAKATEYRTMRGEQRLVELDDGLSLTINTESALTVRSGPTVREVYFDRGQAVIAAPAGSSIPTRVIADGLEIVIRGATLAISRLVTDRIDVIVTQGSALLMTGGGVHRLETGSLVGIAAGKVVTESSLTVAEQQSLLSWREGIVHFQDVSLAEAVATFARYSTVDIQLGKGIDALRITGVFRLGRPRQFADAIAEALDLQAHHHDGGVVLKEK